MSDLKAISHLGPDLERGQNVADACLFNFYRNQRVPNKLSDLKGTSRFDPDLQREQNVMDAGRFYFSNIGAPGTSILRLTVAGVGGASATSCEYLTLSL